MKKEWMRFVIIAAVVLLVLPNIACQKAAEDADNTATEMTDTAGGETEEGAEAVNEDIEEGADAITDVIEDGKKAIEEGADAVDDVAKKTDEELPKKN